MSFELYLKKWEEWWKGDLSDDCSLITGDGYSAHAEDMGVECVECGEVCESDPGVCDKCGATSGGHWYCSVLHDGKQIFHSTDDDVFPINGKAARKMCAIVIIAHRAMIPLKGKPEYDDNGYELY